MPGLADDDSATFERGGCQVTVVGYDEIVAAAASRRVEVFDGAVVRAPLRRARLSIASGVRESRPVYLLDGAVQADRGPDTPIGALGRDPIGALLSRRAAAGDEWASKVVDGVNTAVSELSRFLRPDRRTQPEPDAAEEHDTVRDDVDTGLRAVLAGPDRSGRVTVEAEVPADDLSAEHLAAMFGILLDVARDSAGGTRPVGPFALRRAPALDGSDSVTLDQVGGLDDVVTQFREIAVSFRHPQVMARWGARRPQGILLYGPPGTGKTMLARALAAEIGANFREIRTPEILDKWLGASERNIKRIFRDARGYREPTLLLFDEFDSIIGYTGSGDAAGQAVNAVAGIFKQEMNDLIDVNPNVIVVATTNFPERVDESLIRSGRFDVRLAIPRPDQAGRAQILAKMIGQLIGRHEVAGFRMFADDLDIEALAAASAGMTGADLKEALRRTQLAKAMQEARTGVPAPPIEQDDLQRGITELRDAGGPSR